jgi:diguanylate cyclase (GGDEF)-like protein/PAS domain S-box-containing protein
MPKSETSHQQAPAQSSPKKENKELTFAVNLMKHLVVPTFVLDSQCKVLIWNIACERLTGVPSSEVIGSSDHWRGFYAAPRPCLADLIVQDRLDLVHEFYAQYDNVEEKQKSLYAENWCVMPRLGTRRYLAIDAGAIYDDTGTLIAVVETLRDMTVQREAQLALEQLATKDGLTGIPNRRAFDDVLQTEWRRAIRESKPISLLMVDVDHFKNYNDSFGHQAGDECLKRVAETMAKSLLRPGDFVARYGGEEFAVILPNVDRAGATLLAERIRMAVEQHHIQNSNHNGAPLTVSVGAASALALEKITATELLRAADAALYQAKHEGRHRVVAVDFNVAKIS